MYKLRVKGNLFKNLNDFPTEPSSVWGIGNMLRSKWHMTNGIDENIPTR